MSEQLDILKQVARRLETANISYMISGSIALSYFAQPRLTRDIDIVIELYNKDTERLVGSFSKDYYIDETVVKDAVARAGMFNVIHLASMMKVDFIVRKHTPYRQAEFERRRQVKIGDDSIWFVTPEDLVLSKLIWASDSRSEMQFNDVRTILKDVKLLDWNYVKHWANALNITELLNEVRS